MLSEGAAVLSVGCCGVQQLDSLFLFCAFLTWAAEPRRSQLGLVSHGEQVGSLRLLLQGQGCASKR